MSANTEPESAPAGAETAASQPSAGSDPAGTQQTPGEHAAGEIDQLRAEAQQARDQMLRALAELENVRKRAQRDVEQAHRYALEKFAAELLPVKDSLELAVENASRADAAQLAEGQAATLKLLAKAFERGGIVEIDPQGQPFDANQHEAMAAQPSETAEPNSVLAVVQRGYLLNGRLLRPARVIVAREPGM